MQASPAEQRVHVWHPPGARVAVEIPLPVVEAIGEWARAGLETYGRGIEIGGLLIGHSRRERGLTVVEVTKAEPVQCEHAAGPSFMLSNDDRRGLEAQMRLRKGSIVGFYRSNTRRDFVATVEDAGLYSSHFPEASSVMLLVDVRRGQPLRAGFVARNGREIQPEPGGVFTFEADALAAVASRPAPVVVPAPRPARVPGARLSANWIAAAAVVLGVSGGVFYDRAHRERPAPPVQAAKVEAARPAEVVGERPPSSRKPAVPLEQATAAPLPPPLPVSADGNTSVPPPTSALPSVPSAPFSASADRKAPEALVSLRRPFIAPAAAPRSIPAETIDPPVVAAPSVTTAPVIAEAPRTAPPAPAPSVPAPKVEPRVAVAVDALPARGARYVPPAPLASAAPLKVSVEREVVINVKVYLDRTGKVEFAELLSDGTGANRDLASLAVFSARRWRFSPARVDGKVVPAQAVLRFRFEPD